MAGVKTRVARAADAALGEQQFVTLVDVLIGLGWLTPAHVERWQRGRVRLLEPIIPVDPAKVAEAADALQHWAKEHRLTPTTAAVDGRRFSADDALDRVFGTRWATAEHREPPAGASQPARPRELVVILPLKDWTCASCGGTGDYLLMEDAGPLCMDCADLGHLEFLPSGDAALTRRSKMASRLSAVVVRWSRARKRYERQGILAEPEAIERAERECLSDAESRARRRERDKLRRADEDVQFVGQLTAAIEEAFPGCPRPEDVARHAAVRGSGRVGRSAAGRRLDPDAVRLAVAASVRHVDTEYDELLMSGMDRELARERVRGQVDKTLDEWRRPG